MWLKCLLLSFVIFSVLDKRPSWMFFVQDHLQVVDLNIAPQSIPKKNTKYLRTSKGGFCRYDFVFFSFRVCYDLTPIFCCGREDFKHESKIDDQICDNLCIGPKFDPFPRGLREPVPLRYLLLQTGCCFIVFRRLEKRHDKQLSFCTRRIPTSHSFRAPANGLLEWCLWLFHAHN